MNEINSDLIITLKEAAQKNCPNKETKKKYNITDNRKLLEKGREQNNKKTKE